MKEKAFKLIENWFPLLGIDEKGMQIVSTG